MDKILFYELQRGSGNRLLIILPVVQIITLLVAGYWLIHLLYSGSAFSMEMITNVHFLILGVLALLIGIVVIIYHFNLTLTTRIYQDHIQIIFLPFKKAVRIESSEIVSFKLRKYGAYREYCGYGVKNHRSRGKAYTLKGKTGLQLFLKDGSKLLVGTQKKQAIECAMGKMMKESSVYYGKKENICIKGKS